MKYHKGIIAGVIFLISACNTPKPDCRSLPDQMEADSLRQIAERTEIEFSVNEDQVINQLKARIGTFTEEEKSLWEKVNWLEYREINGEKRYFSRAVTNLYRIRSFHFERAARDSAESRDPEMVERKKHTQAIIRESSVRSEPVLPEDIQITYTLTVQPDAVPAGETVRCWLPYPKENHPRQTDVKFISASQEDFQISPDSAMHRTIYMEAIALKGKPVIFRISFSYRSSGHYFNPANINTGPYSNNSALYKKYTSEQVPHIRFTEEVMHITDSIAGSGETHFETVRKIYHWFSNNIPWAGAPEYSIIPDIPDYVLTNRRGDCGMQTLLLMSMLRYKGIPVRWQSGWKVPPGYKNLHDWCEVWFEGTGWVPLDVSYGLQYSVDRKTREFYVSGIDSYRLIVNDGIGGSLYPAKKFLRSEPYDFQRGEVEWRCGNLYFDKWDYQMTIEYGK